MEEPTDDSSFTDRVAQVYESMLVPLIFLPYADDIAARVEALNPSAILEVAAGTGVATRAIVERLPPTATITATDLNQAMVDHAEAVGTARPVHWRQADVGSLPFPDSSFDAVICQFGVMFFPDRVAAYREIRRVLRPGAPFVFSVWRAIDTNEFADIVTTAVGELFPDDPPRFLARTPHGHSDPDAIAEDLRAAGFRDWGIDRRDDHSPASGPDVAAIAYCHGTPLRNEIEARDPNALGAATDAATAAIRDRFGNGPMTALISALIITAR